MSLRLLKVLVDEDHCDQLLDTLDEHGVGVHWSTRLDGRLVAVDAVVDAAGNEPLMDALHQQFADTDRFRLLFFALEATLPRIEESEEEPQEESEGDEPDDEAPEEVGGGPPEREREPDDESARDEPAGDKPDDDQSTTDEASGDRPRPRFLKSGPHPETPGSPSQVIRSATPRETPWWAPKRINREELYTDVAEMADADPNYIIMTALSAVVATAGLLLGDGAVIIGAMVIAPLIGPSMGLAFATTLGDLEMGWKSLLASLSGVATAFIVSLLAGLAMTVDPEGSEIFGRTRLTYEHLALALAAGAAGALALTQGRGAGLVGVMVAVALLPPLANAGLLLGDGHVTQGVGALVLVTGNVVCVNLAATATFLILGVRPNTWWEDTLRKRAVWFAAFLWGLMLLALMVIVWIAWGGEAPSL